MVSARLQATAAPDAPEPMISTSTMSLLAMSQRSGASRHILRPAAHRIQQRPVALFQRVPLREWRPRLDVPATAARDRRGSSIAGSRARAPRAGPPLAWNVAATASARAASRSANAPPGESPQAGQRARTSPRSRPMDRDDVGEDHRVIGAGHAEYSSGGIIMPARRSRSRISAGDSASFDTSCMPAPTASGDGAPVCGDGAGQVAGVASIGTRAYAPTRAGRASGAAGRRPAARYAASANCPLIVSPCGPADTCTVSPSFTAPSRISPASGFCSARWITRFSGRAP